jgi:hypothetical protein
MYFCKKIEISQIWNSILNIKNQYVTVVYEKNCGIQKTVEC